MEFGASYFRAAKSLGLSTHTAYRWMTKARLGHPPYAELMFPVLQVVKKWRPDAESTGKREDPAAEKSRTDEGHGTTRELVGAPP